jgi:hypothetical protein
MYLGNNQSTAQVHNRHLVFESTFLHRRRYLFWKSEMPQLAICQVKPNSIIAEKSHTVFSLLRSLHYVCNTTFHVTLEKIFLFAFNLNAVSIKPFLRAICIFTSPSVMTITKSGFSIFDPITNGSRTFFFF